ncbi:hypothetical protein [Algoriphagus resistens]|uniref:hypothetical protein n=1 Tax=Algoriphagus resistens TaxID=1750590 RepID=UPI0007167BA6|nr:hypothetical protein [Algoriphagus resistens]
MELQNFTQNPIIDFILKYVTIPTLISAIVILIKWYRSRKRIKFQVELKERFLALINEKILKSPIIEINVINESPSKVIIFQFLKVFVFDKGEKTPIYKFEKKENFTLEPEKQHSFSVDASLNNNYQMSDFKNYQIEVELIDTLEKSYKSGIISI